MGRDPLGRAFLALMLVWTLTIPLSIAIAEIAMWTAAVIWSVNWIRRELSAANDLGDAIDPGPAGDVLALIGAPLMAFWAASVVSAILSRDPVDSLLELREIFLFAAPLVTFVAFRDPRLRRWGLLAFATGVAVTVLWGFAQTIEAVGDDTLPGSYRPNGALSHYMTYAGLLMIAVPNLLIIRERPLSVILRGVAIAATVVIGLTMTRSAWLGLLTGLTVYFLTRWVGGAGKDSGPPRRWAGVAVTLFVALVLGGVLLLSFAGPEVLYQRGASIFSLDNATNLDRLAMAATGLRLISNYPLLGIGPGLMERVYPAWRVEWAVKEENPHLHNNALQIAAERGLIGLALWLWTMAAFVVGSWRVLRYSGPYGEGGPEARAALAALAAFLTMGLFEYNFSDSEVLMALLFIASVPFAASAGLAHAIQRRPVVIGP